MRFSLLAGFVLSVLSSSAAVRKQMCPPCMDVDCPTDCPHEWVKDPCSCCPNGLCPSSEGEECSDFIPCSEGLFCYDEDDQGTCRCKESMTPVCSHNNETYSSICAFKAKAATHGIGFGHWGPCPFGPEILTGPNDQKLDEGEPLILDCEVTGFPIPNVQWVFRSRDGETVNLPSDDLSTAIHLRGGPESMMVTSWVQKVKTRLSDLGTYVCIASSSLGRAKKEAVIELK